LHSVLVSSVVDFCIVMAYCQKNLVASSLLSGLSAINSVALSNFVRPLSYIHWTAVSSSEFAKLNDTQDTNNRVNNANNFFITNILCDKLLIVYVMFDQNQTEYFYFLLNFLCKSLYYITMQTLTALIDVRSADILGICFVVWLISHMRFGN